MDAVSMRRLSTPSFHFKCTQCGKCCTGRGGRVRVNGREIDALRRELRLSRAELEAQFLTRERGDATWRIRQTPDDAQCVFLKGNKCSVYEARPTQCRTFPWWPQNLVSGYDWQLAARHCEGIELGGSERTTAYKLEDVLPETIVYDIHRSGENYTYDELHDMLHDLREVDPTFVEEYAKELQEKFHRRIVFQDESVTVLDTFLEGSTPTRCFVFNDRLHLVQSEMHLNSEGDTLDPSVLVLDVHQAMCNPLSWSASVGKSKWNIALLGSGGGSLARYLLHAHQEHVELIHAVEPNTKVNEIARRFFGLDDEGKLVLFEEFGEDFVERQLKDLDNRGLYDFVFVDVEAGNPDDDVVAPPRPMLEPKFLDGLSQLLRDAGVIVINVIAKDEKALRKVAAQVVSAIGEETKYFYTRLPQNTVVYVSRKPRDFPLSQDPDEFGSLKLHDLQDLINSNPE